MAPESATAQHCALHMVVTQQFFIIFNWIRYFLDISLDQKLLTTLGAVQILSFFVDIFYSQIAEGQNIYPDQCSLSSNGPSDRDSSLNSFKKILFWA